MRRLLAILLGRFRKWQGGPQAKNSANNQVPLFGRYDRQRENRVIFGRVKKNLFD